MSITSTITQEQYLKERIPCILACAGCKRVVVGEDEQPYCKSYLFPDVKWQLGNCNFATHLLPGLTAKQKSMNALKKSKRNARGTL